MARRKSRGRQKIPIKLIANQDDLYATFSKRRLGVYKKASELSTLCGVDIGVIISSPTGNPFSFFHPSLESVVTCHRNPNQQINDFTRVVNNHTRGKITNLNKALDEVLDEKEHIKEREKELDEAVKTQEKGWWVETPVESLNIEQVREWKTWFGNLNAFASRRTEKLKNEDSGSTTIHQEQNASSDIIENAPIDAGADPSNYEQRYARSGVPYTSSGGMLNQYYGPQHQHGYNPFLGAGTRDVAGMSSNIHRYFPSPAAYNPFASGTGVGNEAGPNQWFATPRPTHNSFAGVAGAGGGGHSQWFTTPGTAHNTFVGVGRAGEAGLNQWFAIPRPDYNPFASVDGGAGQAGPNQWFGRPHPSPHNPFSTTTVGRVGPSMFPHVPSRNLYPGSGSPGPSQFYVPANPSAAGEAGLPHQGDNNP